MTRFLPHPQQPFQRIERDPVTDTILKLGEMSSEADKLYKRLSESVIGQDRAIRRIVKAYIPTTVNLHRENRPMGVFLFMGPTGVGKSETVKAFAEILLGSSKALTKIDCTEFQSSHEAAKLLGAPPGYVGYGEIPRLAQEKIDQFQTKDSKINIILFDEIEKADPRLFDSILSILGDGQLTLGNGKSVDFSRSFIFLTSNLGSSETRTLIEGSGIGFNSHESDRTELDQRIYRVSKEAVKKKFRPEFSNRLDSVVVFRSLAQDTLKLILKKELDRLQWDIWKSPYRDFDFSGAKKNGLEIPARFDVRFALTEECKAFILKEGTSEVNGARELQRTIDKYVRYPLASLISSKQLGTGDKVLVDHVEDQKDLSFRKYVPELSQ